jgi:hypothetical protein
MFNDEQSIRLKQLVPDEDDITDICTKFFVTKNLVIDVSRYYALIKNRKVRSLICNEAKDFPCSQYFDIDPFKSNGAIVLILESPHKDEYCYCHDKIHPIAPAQGSSGENIEHFLKIHIQYAVKNDLLSDGCYPIIIANPIQWQTSLWHYHRKGIKSSGYIRNDVWLALWNCEGDLVKNDFVKRLDSYQPVLVINACTGKSKDYEHDIIVKASSDTKEASIPIHYHVENMIKRLKRNYKTISIYHPASLLNFKSTKYNRFY